MLTDAMQAEVKCRSCGLTKWVLWDDRHKGTEKEQNVDGAGAIRCKFCPTNRDWVYYTGQWRDGEQRQEAGA